MAAEMSIPFIGRVPIDVKFGQLVESQKVGDDIDSDYDDEDDNGHGNANGQQQEIQQTPVESDNRILADRYKDCWSHAIFEGFTNDLLRKIEGR